MPLTSIVCGVLLILIGIIGYAYGVMTDHVSITALIPTFFGIGLALLGIAARVKEGLRMHLMHAAIIVALLGFLATAGRLVSKFGELSLSAAVVAQISMAIVCLLLIILGIKSFVDARGKAQ